MIGRCCTFLLLLSLFYFSEAVKAQSEELAVLRKTLEDLTSTVHFQNKRLDALQKIVLRQRMRARDEYYCKSCKVHYNEWTKGSTLSETLFNLNPNSKKAVNSSSFYQDNKPKPIGNAQKLQRKERLLYQPSSAASAEDNIVAFYAYFSADVRSLGLSETLKYDVVKTNQGSGYHPSSGVFIAPEEGYYVFTWTIRLYHYGDSTAENFSTELIVNGDVYGSAYLRAHLDDDDQSTATAVAHVNEGEDVYVRTHSSYSSTGSIRSNTHGRSSFAGWKIN
ncbi:uncharacterized protein LOC134253717 [Saccostrea cucullata]|uniref:uncharacterized protein LOC134253717 n=1 Tax=Saccostrea cuccullata TaxID=36930 RepID=UPI002ED0F4A9